MSASDYTEAEILKHLLRTGSMTKPSNIYVALFTSSPTDAGTGGAEVANGIGYARVLYGPGDAYWSAPSASGQSSNVSDITFGVPTGTWGEITAVGLYDASSGGSLLVVGALTTSRTVSNNDPAPKFLAGDLVITVS